MLHTTEINWTDGALRHKVQVIDPESTTVKAVAAAARALVEAAADHRTVSREYLAAKDDPTRLAHEATVAAREAGRDGKAVEPKKLRKKVREAEENVAELRLMHEAAASKLLAARRAYLDTVEHHAPALAAEARAEAEAGILSLATASSMARKAGAQTSGALAILAALAAVQDDAALFEPKAPRAKSARFGGGVPAPHVSNAVEGLTAAIGFATEILEEMADADKKRARQDDADANLEELDAADLAPDGDDDDDDLNDDSEDDDQ